MSLSWTDETNRPPEGAVEPGQDREPYRRRARRRLAQRRDRQGAPARPPVAPLAGQAQRARAQGQGQGPRQGRSRRAARPSPGPPPKRRAAPWEDDDEAEAPAPRPPPQPRQPSAEPAKPAAPQPVVRSIGPGGFVRQGPSDQQAPIPPAPPRRLVPAKPSPEVADKTGLLDLNERICKWPIGHPGEPDFHFCGDHGQSGLPLLRRALRRRLSGPAPPPRPQAAAAAALRRAAGALTRRRSASADQAERPVA